MVNQLMKKLQFKSLQRCKGTFVFESKIMTFTFRSPELNMLCGHKKLKPYISLSDKPKVKDLLPSHSNTLMVDKFCGILCDINLTTKALKSKE